MADAGEPVVLGVGPLGLDLYEKLEEKHFHGGFINPLFLFPLDVESSKRLLSSSAVYIYDPYATAQGFGEALAALLAQEHYQGQVIIKAAPNVFVHHDNVDAQLAKYHLTVQDALDEILALKSK